MLSHSGTRPARAAGGPPAGRGRRGACRLAGPGPQFAGSNSATESDGGNRSPQSPDFGVALTPPSRDPAAAMAASQTGLGARKLALAPSSGPAACHKTVAFTGRLAHRLRSPCPVDRIRAGGPPGRPDRDRYLLTEDCHGQLTDRGLSLPGGTATTEYMAVSLQPARGRSNSLSNPFDRGNGDVPVG